MDQRHHDRTAGNRSRALPAALVLFSGLVIIFAAFFVVRSTHLWYWTPLTENTILKLYALDTDPTRYDAVIIGASVADFGYYPEEMEAELQQVLPRPQGWKVFNCSIHAAFMPTYLDVMRNIIGRSQRPKALVLALTNRDFNGNSRRVSRQIRFFTRNPADFWLVLRDGTNEQRWATAHAATHGLEALLQVPLKPWFRPDVAYFQRTHGKIMLSEYDVLASVLNKDASGQVAPEVLERLRSSGVKYFREELMNDFAINDLIDVWFRGILDEARDQGIPIAVVLSPETQWFYDHAYRGEKELVIAYLTRVCAEYNAPFYDLRDPRFRPADTDFFDRCDHLTPPGAVRFSRAVTRFVLAPLLAGGQPLPAPAVPAAAPAPVPAVPIAGATASPAPRLPDGKPVPGRTGMVPSAPAGN